MSRPEKERKDRPQLDHTWVMTFIAQVVVGLGLIVWAESPHDAELGRLLLASAFGQGLTARKKVFR